MKKFLGIMRKFSKKTTKGPAVKRPKRKDHASTFFVKAKSGKLIIKTDSGIYTAEKIKSVDIEGYPKYL